MDRFRDEFIHRWNVAHYTRELRAPQEAGRREILMSLLAEERTRGRQNGWVQDRA